MPLAAALLSPICVHCFGINIVWRWKVQALKYICTKAQNKQQIDVKFTLKMQHVMSHASDSPPPPQYTSLPPHYVLQKDKLKNAKKKNKKKNLSWGILNI